MRLFSLPISSRIPLRRTSFSIPSPFRLLLGLIVAPVTLIVGFLIIQRKPGNVVGPMLVLWGAANATWALRNDIEITTMAVLGSAASVGWNVLIVLGFYFPTGRVVPERWHRWISYLIFLAVAATFLAIPTSATLNFLLQQHPNPLYLPVMEPFREVTNAIAALPILLLPFMVYSLYRRYKQADPVERQQLKWVAYAFLLLVLIVPVLATLQNTAGVLAESANLLLYGWLYLFPASVSATQFCATSCTTSTSSSGAR